MSSSNQWGFVWEQEEAPWTQSVQFCGAAGKPWHFLAAFFIIRDTLWRHIDWDFLSVSASLSCPHGTFSDNSFFFSVNCVCTKMPWHLLWQGSCESVVHKRHSRAGRQRQAGSWPAILAKPVNPRLVRGEGDPPHIQERWHLMKGS